jgi:hypothetical protein
MDWNLAYRIMDLKHALSIPDPDYIPRECRGLAGCNAVERDNLWRQYRAAHGLVPLRPAEWVDIIE